MITKKQLEFLVCPMCTETPSKFCGDMNDHSVVLEGTIECTDCGRKYPIRNGIPIFFPFETSLNENLADVEHEKVQEWKDHLKVFLKFRQRFWKEAGENIIKESDICREEFVKFCSLESGIILDVACGNGVVRTSSNWNRNVGYWGLDPILIDHSLCDFPFVQGIAEYLPFRKDTFDAVVIKSSLGHLYDYDLFFNGINRILKKGGKFVIGQFIQKRESTDVRTIANKVKTTVKIGARRSVKEVFRRILEPFRSIRSDGQMRKFYKEDLVDLVSSQFKIDCVNQIDSFLLIKAKKGE